jgi:hypothetical protein
LLTGQFAGSFPALARRMAAAGRLGNHMAEHPHLPTMTDGQVRRQVASTRARSSASRSATRRPTTCDWSTTSATLPWAGPSTPSAGRGPRVVAA